MLSTGHVNGRHRDRFSLHFERDSGAHPPVCHRRRDRMLRHARKIESQYRLLARSRTTRATTMNPRAVVGRVGVRVGERIQYFFTALSRCPATFQQHTNGAKGTSIASLEISRRRMTDDFLRRNAHFGIYGRNASPRILS